jgi:two-component system chemotaxis response regulator CheY
MASTVVIADDSRTVRRMVREALEQDSHLVLEACDGQDALTVLESNAADLVITDVNMPRMDGLSLVRAIRQSQQNRFVPILVLTTESGSDMKQKGRDAGATGWIVKPFEAGTLREVVRRVLRKDAA